LSEEVRRAVERLNLAFGEGFRRGDAAAVAALYTDDAVLLPPNSEIVRGRQGIEKYWRKAIQNGLKDVVMTTIELSVSGDAFHVIGDYTAKISDKGQKLHEEKGKYIIIGKRTAAGWKVHRDIWNSSMPPRRQTSSPHKS
jgi:uncharacterized protein (TIGR02246 family)